MFFTATENHKNQDFGSEILQIIHLIGGLNPSEKYESQLG